MSKMFPVLHFKSVHPNMLFRFSFPPAVHPVHHGNLRDVPITTTPRHSQNKTTWRGRLRDKERGVQKKRGRGI